MKKELNQTVTPSTTPKQTSNKTIIGGVATIASSKSIYSNDSTPFKPEENIKFNDNSRITTLENRTAAAGRAENNSSLDTNNTSSTNITPTTINALSPQTMSKTLTNAAVNHGFSQPSIESNLTHIPSLNNKEIKDLITNSTKTDLNFSNQTLNDTPNSKKITHQAEIYREKKDALENESFGSLQKKQEKEIRKQEKQINKHYKNSFEQNRIDNIVISHQQEECVDQVMDNIYGDGLDFDAMAEARAARKQQNKELGVKPFGSSLLKLFSHHGENLGKKLAEETKSDHQKASTNHTSTKKVEPKKDTHSTHKHGADKHGADKHGADKHGADKHGADKHGADKHGTDKRSENTKKTAQQGAGKHSENTQKTAQQGLNKNVKNINISASKNASPITQHPTKPKTKEEAETTSEMINHAIKNLSHKADDLMKDLAQKTDQVTNLVNQEFQNLINKLQDTPGTTKEKNR